MQSSGEHDGNDLQVGVASREQMLGAAAEPRGISSCLSTSSTLSDCSHFCASACLLDWQASVRSRVSLHLRPHRLPTNCSLMNPLSTRTTSNIAV